MFRKVLESLVEVWGNIAEVMEGQKPERQAPNQAGNQKRVDMMAEQPPQPPTLRENIHTQPKIILRSP
jgi:hypothetical protein